MLAKNPLSNVYHNTFTEQKHADQVRLSTICTFQALPHLLHLPLRNMVLHKSTFPGITHTHTLRN